MAPAHHRTHQKVSGLQIFALMPLAPDDIFVLIFHPCFCRRAFLTKLDIHGDTHPGLWERFNRMIDKITPRNNERTNDNDASSRQVYSKTTSLAEGYHQSV